MSYNLAEFTCDFCGQTSHKRLALVNWNKKLGQKNFCSQKCHHAHKKTGEIVSCKNCNKKFYKTQSQIKITKNNFCSSSCSAIYHNSHKTKGCRRSKLELYLEEELQTLYPNILFLFNDKTTIGSELDIYIPSLKLAFELNGIFHYEPIYGQDKLNQIQNNDQRKYQACIESQIELCIIDSSSLKYFKKSKADLFLKIIVDIINQKSRMD